MTDLSQHIPNQIQFGMDAYDWWFGGCVDTMTGPPAALKILIPIKSPFETLQSAKTPRLETPSLTIEEYHSDSDSSSQSPSACINSLLPPSLRLEKAQPLGLFGANTEMTFLEYEAELPSVMNKEEEFKMMETDDQSSLQSDDIEEPQSPMSPMPQARKGRSNSVGSIYKDIDISCCKKTKKASPHRRGSVTIFSCPFAGCSRSFDRSFNLRAHYSTHLGMKMFTCQGCSKKFTRKFDVKRHQSSGPCMGFEILTEN